MIYYFKKRKVFVKIFTVINIVLLLMTTYSFAEKERGFVQLIPSHSWFFDTPSGVAVDQDGNIYVADSGNDRIQLYR